MRSTCIGYSESFPKTKIPDLDRVKMQRHKGGVRRRKSFPILLFHAFTRSRQGSTHKNSRLDMRVLRNRYRFITRLNDDPPSGSFFVNTSTTKILKEGSDPENGEGRRGLMTYTYISCDHYSAGLPSPSELYERA